MTEEDIKIHSHNYEQFICRAFDCYPGQHGADSGTMKFLLMDDNGEHYLVKAYDQQLKEVNQCLTKAIDKFLTRKPTDYERAFLKHMKVAVVHASKATELVQLLEDGLATTARFQNF